MAEKDYGKIIEVVKKQEEMLRFEHFNNQDAWELGKLMVEMVKERGIDLSISIRKCNGNIVFQYQTDGTSALNSKWMQRKFNTVSLQEMSSFRAWAQSLVSGETVPVHGLDEKEYVFCGGGFPIKLKTGEMVGVLLVSNLPHQDDHQFLIDALSKYLSVDDVPSALSLFNV